MKIEALLNEKIDVLHKRVTEYPWQDRMSYGAWLAQTYFFVKESTRLLNLCGALLPQKDESLHKRFIDHAHEEKGHADVLVRDLNGLKLSLSDFHELPETAAFYQSQYYWIMFRNPISFFGYIFLLEMLAVKWGPVLAEKAGRIHGRQSTAFLKAHGAEDVDHTREALKIFAQFSPSEKEIILQNFDQSLYQYERILEQCCLQSGKRNEQIRSAA